MSILQSFLSNAKDCLQRNLGREMAKLQQGKTSQKTELYRKVFSTVSLSISARRPLSAKYEVHLSVGDCTGHPSSEWSSEGTGELS